MYGYTPASLAQLVRLNQDTRLIRVKSPLDPEAFVIRRMRGVEYVSRPFAFTVELLSLDAHLELKQVIGQPMRLSLRTQAGEERHFHGYVREFGRTGAEGGMAVYQAELQPWFAFLDCTSNCRIFQDRTVLEIVEEVFAGYGDLAKCKYDVQAARYPKLPYCVQYNESDFAFVSRLLEDAGVHYSFEHAEDEHLMFIADDSTQARAIDGAGRVNFVADDAVRDDYGLDRWTTRRRVGTSVQALKSFDFKQPKSPLAVDRPLDIPLGRLPQLESYRYDGAARYVDSAIGDALASLRGEESAWQTKLFEGAGNHGLLQAGRHFVLHGHYEHSEGEEEERKFLLLQVAHEIRNNFNEDFSVAEGASYRCEVACLRRKIPFRPLRATPQPRMPGPQTATVVGPAGEEIHADKYGRVKVQFHWDRLGSFDERSSCWVRVASPWAGSDMGGVSPPRIDQEVVVDFLDGDPDRPLIVNRVYNELNMPPFGNEVSGIKSKTVKGAGYNELSMHDADGKQMLNMHAQRDMSTTVLNDQTAAITSNKATTVGQNQTLSVGVDQTISVGGNRAIAVTGDDTHDVAGARTSTVSGAVAETYKTGQTLTIPAVGYTETIVGPLSTTLTGDFTSQRTGAWKETVVGTSDRIVTAALTEQYGAGRTTSITGTDLRAVMGAVEDANEGPRTVSVTGNLEHGVSGTHTAFSGGDMSMGSGSRIALGVGEVSGITITGGEIVIASAGSTIVINASGVTVNGAKINLN
ncbi:type VI secretion system tip protein TssI/VgrG [Lysobacter yananisis]|uniref:Type VI secretion system tip protein TssI/VgrG n=1 Tax=Lysobacter yananisis TaxID=1003114 RepID=A0ABY9PD02_9GAMM|nr:type VI secretion system tip protein TssI/VgrG [Lysobacter yananisis]WMT04061.1 type VI secretion system tip protein TssI/VgrG [Lysobacter yananisis]